MTTDALGTETVTPPRPAEGARSNRRTADAASRAQLVPILALVSGCLLTIASFGTTWVHLAYRLPRMHAVIDTAIGLVSLLLAYLVYGRVLALHRQRDYVLAFALGFSGFVNLFAAISQSVSAHPLDRAAVWTTLVGQLLVAVLFAAASVTPDARIDRTTPMTRLVAGLAIAFVALMAVVYLFASGLPWSSDLTVSPRDASKPLFVGPTLMLVTQAVIAIAYAIAGWNFIRLRRPEHDDLMTWLASYSLLFALASVDYLAFPSIFSDWIYVGDILRLAGVVLLLVGAAREISRYRREAAAIDERRRIARDLHDGVAQELAYISTMAHRLENDPAHRDVHRLADAAQHALDESRLVIAALAGAGNASEQLTLTARDAARRFDLRLTLHCPPALELPAEVVESLQRITREAITNTGRHAHAHAVSVTLDAGDPIVLEITDDGMGFDARHTHGFGLTSMRERAEAIGATYLITSSSAGTTIRVTLS
jgi:signal transduction histidine kinase